MKTLRTLMQELYGEPEKSVFTHDGKDYDLNLVLSYTLGMEQTIIPVSQLKWILRWDPMTAKDSRRIRYADLSAPLLVVKWHSKWVVVDGVHRLALAVKRRVNKLPCIVVPDSVMNRARLGY